MPRPFGSCVNLNSEQRETLEGLVRAHSTPQALVFRCRIILDVAQSELRTNQHGIEIALNGHNPFELKGIVGHGLPVGAGILKTRPCNES
jgi:hypothetical protein